MTDVDVPIESGPFTLRGSLTIAAAAPTPAALLISGSGPLDRNSNSKQLAIDVMGQIAARLAAEGVASLRYDKRGVAESDGDFLAAGFHDNIDDARAALAVLRARPDVDPDRIVVIGHSEGALIASVLADDERLAGVALLAGTVHDGNDLLRWQAGQIASTLPKPVRWMMKLLRQDLVRTQSKRLQRIADSTEDVVRIQFVKLNAKWFREFMVFDPTEALRRVAVPVLAITGSKDIQVDPADVERMREVVSTSFTGCVAEDVSHLLRTEPGPPTVRTYKKQARLPLEPRVVTKLAEWVAATTDIRRGGDHGCV